MTRLVAILAMAALLTATSSAGAGVAPAGRQRISVAYLEDPSREVIFHPMLEGPVRSERVELAFAPLSIEAIIQAAGTRQYDVVEATPLAVPRAAQRGFKMLIFAAGLENMDGTLVFVRADSPIHTPRDLRGKTIAVGSLGGTFVLETRFVLKQRYGFNVDMAGGDVRFVELPFSAMAPALARGQVDAVLALHVLGHAMLKSRDFRLLFTPTREYKELTGQFSINSIFITYPDRAKDKGLAVREFQRMLRESVAYVQQHRERVITAVSARYRSDPEYIRDWWRRYSFGGPLDLQRLRGIQRVWEAGRAVGDLQTVPPISELLFK